MPPGFTERFADRLDANSAYDVSEAADRDWVRAGEVAVAPGNHHLEVARNVNGALRLRLDDGKRVHGVRPSIDVTMESAAERVSDALCGIVLTGMGRDGAAGIEAIKAPAVGPSHRTRRRVRSLASPVRQSKRAVSIRSRPQTASPRRSSTRSRRTVRTMSDYLTDFVQESEERITELNNALLTLEREPDDEEAMENIFRIAHTLKGNCGAMGLESASDLAHAIEDLLDAVRRDELDVTASLMDVVFDAVDELETMIGEVAETGEIRTDPSATIESLRDHLPMLTGRTRESNRRRRTKSTTSVPGSSRRPTTVTTSISPASRSHRKRASTTGNWSSMH